MGRETREAHYEYQQDTARLCMSLPCFIDLSDRLQRSGKYYKPWNSSKRVVIVTGKKQIMELSETPDLSQRAVYADVCTIWLLQGSPFLLP